MGYDVYYNGALTPNPPLREEDAALFQSLVTLEKTEQTEPIFAAS